MATAKEMQELEEASNESGDVASAALDAKLKTVMSHVSRLDQLRPKMADEATYQKLVTVIKEATRRNESVATLRANVQKLGAGTVAMLDEIARSVRKII